MVRFADADSDAVTAATQRSGFLAQLEMTRYCCQVLKRYEYRLEAEPAANAAWSACLENPVGDYWLAIGDCAASHDPLSSQGLMSAMEDGLDAADAILHALAGDGKALAHYARTRGDRFESYLNQRDYFYSREQRWPNAPFWALRQP